jgi:predicted RNase H-like HicB family nuclease
MRRESRGYQILFARTDTGYSAHIPDLPGIAIAGSSLTELLANADEAIDLHLEGMRADGETVPEPTREPIGRALL